MKNMTLIFLGICSLGVLIAQTYNSSRWREYFVPLEISTHQTINSIPKDWAVSPDSNANRLLGVTIYDGFPEENASLVYDKEIHKKQNIILIWTFTGKEKDGIWIVCRYNGTGIQIKKRMPAGMKQLRITVDNNIKICGEPLIQKIEYK